MSDTKSLCANGRLKNHRWRWRHNIVKRLGNNSLTILDKRSQVIEKRPVVDKKEYMLQADEIDQFFTLGWIQKNTLFDAEEVARMRSCFDALEDMASRMANTGLQGGSYFVLGEKNGQPIIKRVVWAGGSQRFLLDIGTEPRLTVPCSQLLQSQNMEQLLSQAHFKRPHDGVIFGWHQDIQHRDKGSGTWTDLNGSGSFVQTLIVIDEMSEDSGPLQFIPGSCNWGKVDFGHHDYDDPGYVPRKPPQFREEDSVTILGKPGDTLFFGPYTAHASFENTSSTYRRVFINGYAFPGANRREYPGDGAGRIVSVGKE